MAALFQSIATLGTRAIDAFWPAANRRAPLAVDLSPPTVTAAPAPAPAAAPPLVLDAHADTLDHVVRAVVHSGFLEEATQLMLASREHLHDPELLYRTRGVRGVRGRTLLMRAVMRCDVARAAEILGACPTPAARAELLACFDANGMAALHLACDELRLDETAALRLVELTLANGADPLTPRCYTPMSDQVWHAIHWAARWSGRLVQRLVQAGASIDGDVEGASTLCAAACACTAQGVRMIPQLVALGARETLGNEAMFTLAEKPVKGAQPTDSEVVAALTALVSIGCSLTQPDGDGLTPLDTASCDGNAPVARALLSLGAPATTSSLVWGIKHPELVRMLLAAGAPPNALAPSIDDDDPTTPLMAAALHTALESVQLLLVAGPRASVHRLDRAGRTALMWAVDSESDDTAAVTRIVDALVEAGADSRAQNNDGDTVLHILALQHAKPWAAAVARLLRDNGANARATNEDGEMPAQLIPDDEHDSELYRALL